MLGPPQPYSQINYLNQILSSGTSIIGTLALDTAVLAFVGRKTTHTRYLAAGLVSSVLISLLYVAVVNASVRAALDAGGGGKPATELIRAALAKLGGR